MKIPKGKTIAQLTRDIHQTELKEFDAGYIDGYTKGGDSRTCAIFVRISDGMIDMVPIYYLKALLDS